jgi:NADPH-dependent F420 reductase
MTLAFLGGTGKLGRGLGMRLAAAGHVVLIGSRSEERARAAAARVRARLEQAGRPFTRVEGMVNSATIPAADVVFLTIPYESLATMAPECIAALAGKIVIDVLNPLRAVDGRFDLAPVAEGSMGMRVKHVAPMARVVSGFKNAAAEHLIDLEHTPRGDILLASDDAEAKAVVAGLVRDIPELRAVDAGPLANAAFLSRSPRSS